jgi:hypothetical protein
VGKLVLPDQLLGDLPQTLAYRSIIGEPGRWCLLAVREVLSTHTLNLGRGCKVERRLCSLLNIYSHEGVDQCPDEVRKAFHAVVKVGGNHSGMECIGRHTCAFELVSQFVGKVDQRQLGLAIGFREAIPFYSKLAEMLQEENVD